MFIRGIQAVQCTSGQQFDSWMIWNEIIQNQYQEFK